MTTRRDFIGGAAMAGVAFVGCELMGTAHVHAQPAARRREVVANGRRVKTVDVHAHCAFPQAMALMGRKVNPETLVMAPERIKAMDEQGIDVEALSINPFWYKADRDLARELIALQNEKLAELCASQPDRFVAFATVALQLPGPGGRAARSTPSRRSACAVRRSAAASTARNFPIRSFTRSGRRPRSWAAHLHPSAGNADFEKRLKGNGGLDQRHRQPARNHDRALAPDLRGDARPFPG